MPNIDRNRAPIPGLNDTWGLSSEQIAARYEAAAQRDREREAAGLARSVGPPKPKPKPRPRPAPTPPRREEPLTDDDWRYLAQALERHNTTRRTR